MSAKPVPFAASGDGHLGRASQFNEIEDFASAIAEMDKAIKEDSNDIGAYDLRSAFKVKIGDYSGALADITKAIELLEKYPYEKFVQYPESKKKILLNRYDERMHINGMRLHDIPALMKDIETVLSMDQSAEAYATCGFHATQTYDPKLRPLAIEYYTKAIELDPSGNEGSYYRWRGISRMNEGDYKGAEHDYGKSLEYHEEDAPAYWNRGEARYRLGDRENALKDLLRAKELGGRCPIIDELIGKIKAGE